MHTHALLQPPIQASSLPLARTLESLAFCQPEQEWAPLTRVQLLGGHAELCIFRDSVGNIRLAGRSSSGTETCSFRYP